MKTILVTGPIGGGKSEACRYLASKGFPVYDSDSRAKALYDSVPGLLERIENELGVSRGDFGIIFSDDGKRLALENILYPAVRDDMLSWKASLPESGTAFIESAVAGEKPVFDGVYDGIWFIDCPLETRAARNPKVRERNGAQQFGHSRGDVIILNDKTIEDLHKKIEDLL